MITLTSVEPGPPVVCRFSDGSEWVLPPCITARRVGDCWWLIQGGLYLCYHSLHIDATPLRCVEYRVADLLHQANRLRA